MNRRALATKIRRETERIIFHRNIDSVLFGTAKDHELFCPKFIAARDRVNRFYWRLGDAIELCR
jgi:hypothetical protein